MKFPDVVDVDRSWWRAADEETREAYRRHLKQFGVDATLLIRVEVEGDRLRCQRLHAIGGQIHKVMYCPDGYSGPLDSICREEFYA